MQNIKTIINSNNKKILNNKIRTERRPCVSLNEDTCPLDQKCLTTNIVYKVKVTSTIPFTKKKNYAISCKTIFKKQFSNHTKSFDLDKYKKETAFK